MKPIRIHIADDKYLAYVTILSDPEHFPSEGDILHQLKKAGVIYGIDEDTIKDIAAKKRSVTMKAVARGRYPRGRLHWQMDIRTSKKPYITSKNRADFKNLNQNTPVEKGQIVAVYHPAESVEPGKKVTGETVEPAGIYTIIPQSEDFYLDKDGKTLRAAKTGYLFRSIDRLQISEVYHIRGDVGYGTGNIKVKGPVVIDGDVRSGFRVESEGTIIVNGSVDAANIYSSHGDVIVRDGILGQGRAKVLCGGKLTCGFAQDARLAAQQDVELTSYAINCTVSAGGFVRVTDSKGVIRGGTITAEKGIVTANAGSERGTMTDLVIRHYSEANSTGRLWKLSKTRLETGKRLSFLQKRRQFLDVLKEKKQKLSAEKQAELEKIDGEMKELAEKLKELEREEAELQQTVSKEHMVKEVQVRDVLYRNVHIDIGGRHYTSMTDLKGVRIFRVKDEILIESLRDKNSDYNIFIPDKTNER
ncbi:MAG TPA: DUF342 domain-containing protein [Caldithrix abyssi]|uniref:DUF342 domain-containing protein n=1 Tax=Caldithrix abyssi TaxID=187145 RepID=A0A7V5RMT4_CALAY|nr:DUF342 domain-containing protein [Caldithrix abyssi]